MKLVFQLDFGGVVSHQAGKGEDRNQEDGALLENKGGYFIPHDADKGTYKKIKVAPAGRPLKQGVQNITQQLLRG